MISLRFTWWNHWGRTRTEICRSEVCCPSWLSSILRVSVRKSQLSFSVILRNGKMSARIPKNFWSLVRSYSASVQGPSATAGDHSGSYFICWPWTLLICRAIRGYGSRVKRIGQGSQDTQMKMRAILRIGVEVKRKYTIKLALIAWVLRRMRQAGELW